MFKKIAFIMLCILFMPEWKHHIIVIAQFNVTYFTALRHKYSNRVNSPIVYLYDDCDKNSIDTKELTI